jgi:predicted double-glycine peptidase
MYSYNSAKNSYVKIANTLELYKFETKIKLTHNPPDLLTDSEKDFDHLTQLIGVYGKILFFTTPSFDGKSTWQFKFGVEQSDLFKFKDDNVGVLTKRFNNLILFGDVLITEGVNTNTWISKI